MLCTNISEMNYLLQLSITVLHLGFLVVIEGGSYNDNINCESFPEVVNYTDSQLQQEALSRGQCIPFRTTQLTLRGLDNDDPRPTPCNKYYRPNVDYIYLPFGRALDDIRRLNEFAADANLVIDVLRPQCREPAARAICYYYYPPCGNATHFIPPNALCQDICTHVTTDICDTEWTQALRFLMGLTDRLQIPFVNCSHPGLPLGSLPHCCSDAGIEVLPASQSSCPYSASDSLSIDIFADILSRDPSTASRLQSAPVVRGVDPSVPAYEFAGMGTGFSISRLSDDIRAASCGHNEVTFTGRVFIRDSQSDGPLLELSYGAGLQQGLAVYLLHMDAAANEITLGYRHLGRLHYETIPTRLIGGKWRDYAVSMSGNLLSFYFNCDLVLQRVVPLPDYCANDSSLVLSVASTASGASVDYTGRTGLYVFLQKVGIHFGPGGVKTQCPSTPEMCPSCGQFLSLLEQLTLSHEEVNSLQARIKELQSGEFPQTTAPPTSPAPLLGGGIACSVEVEGGEIRVIGNQKFLLLVPNRVCFCNNGDVVCDSVVDLEVSTPPPPECPDGGSPSTVRDPVAPSSSPAPRTCLVTSLGVHFDEGSTISERFRPIRRCDVYVCEDLGFGLFARRIPVSCLDVTYSNCSVGVSDVVREGAICCEKCAACDFEQCPVNTECLPPMQSSDPPTCVCRIGYSLADNGSCINIDECSLGPGSPPRGFNCQSNSRCVDTDGSYLCECFEGYTLEMSILDGDSCQDINECDEGIHNCTATSTCVNKKGGYQCPCLEGYTPGPAGPCEPVCDPPCENGGVCSAPSSCSCPPEFTGASCHEDMDECASPSLNTCQGAKKVCVNTVGGHFCRCEAGFQERDSNCHDVDECASRIHNCKGPLARCLNTIGGFRCMCNGKDECTGSCIKRGVRLEAGSSYLDAPNCRTCTCLGAEITCRRADCDCSNLNPLLQGKRCCPKCFTRDCIILNGTISIRPGNSWINPDNRCERYDCLQNRVTEFMDLSVSCPALDCPEALQTTPMGKCCPVCMMPTCTSSLEGERVTLRNGCEQCTCQTSSWECSVQGRCPEVACDPRDIVFYRDDCCPVCRHQVLGSNTTQCFTSL